MLLLLLLMLVSTILLLLFSQTASVIGFGAGFLLRSRESPDSLMTTSKLWYDVEFSEVDKMLLFGPIYCSLLASKLPVFSAWPPFRCSAPFWDVFWVELVDWIKWPFSGRFGDPGTRSWFSPSLLRRLLDEFLFFNLRNTDMLCTINALCKLSSSS